MRLFVSKGEAQALAKQIGQKLAKMDGASDDRQLSLTVNAKIVQTLPTEKRDAVLKAIFSMPDESARAIARLVGVSPVFVTKMKRAARKFGKRIVVRKPGRMPYEMNVTGYARKK